MFFRKGKPWVAFLHFIILFLPTGCDRKHKRMKQNHHLVPIYEEYGSEILPSDTQITTYLQKGETKSFGYRSIIENGPLSVTVTTCSSKVRWNMTFIKNHETDGNISDSFIEDVSTNAMTSRSAIAHEGLYMLHLSPNNSTYVHIYISTEDGGPQALEDGKNHKLKVSKQKKKSLTVRWSPSLVDPQLTTYCLVVNTVRYYGSLCNAESEYFDVLIPMMNRQYNVPELPYDKVKKGDYSLKPAIACVGRKNHYTLAHLQNGQRYYLNLFATNKQSNFTYPFGSMQFILNTKRKSISLKDGKLHSVNLKKLDGKAVLKYKVTKKASNNLKIVVVPCTGSVDVEVAANGEVIAKKRDISRYDRLNIPLSRVNSTRIRIRIITANKGEYNRSSKVQIIATARPSVDNLLPVLPSEMTVQQYESLRTCDRVTIGWKPSPTHNLATYCVMVKEDKLREFDEYRIPNRCELGRRLKKSADFIREYCLDVKEKVLYRLKWNPVRVTVHCLFLRLLKRYGRMTPKLKPIIADLLRYYGKEDAVNEYK